MFQEILMKMDGKTRTKIQPEAMGVWRNRISNMVRERKNCGRIDHRIMRLFCSPSTKIVRPNHNITVSKHLLDIFFKYFDIFKTYDKVFNFFYSANHPRDARRIQYRCFFVVKIRIYQNNLVTIWNGMFHENLVNVSWVIAGRQPDGQCGEANMRIPSTINFGRVIYT